MAKIDLGQIDEFKYTFTEEVQDGEIPVWNAANQQFEPEPQAGQEIVFRRAMLLMGA